MKLYNSVGPNPKVVRMFMAECGVKLDLQEIDLMAGENRQDSFMKLNPTGTDVLLFCFLEFGGQVGQPLNEANKNIMGWYERVAARPSATA